MQVGQGTFPTAWLEFVRLFNEEAFWESHEVLEQPWRRNKSPFYRGMIIYASAFVHAQRGNPVGVQRQMAKAKRYLSGFVPNYMGLDLARLLEHVDRCAALARAIEAFGSDPGWPGRFPYDRLELREELIRGDEPELVD